MRKFFYRFSNICALFLLIPLYLSAQETSCDGRYSISAATTPSTCLNNGTVTVTLNGDLSDMTDIQYVLINTNTGEEAARKLTTVSAGSVVFNNLFPGTYRLDVRAFCVTSGIYGVTKNLSDPIVIEDQYDDPSVAFFIPNSRRSYSGCDHGIIALQVSGGNGHDFSFEIIDAPRPDLTGPVAATPVNDNPGVYILAGDTYPSGVYRIRAVDEECGNGPVANFDLTLNSFPRLNYIPVRTYSYFEGASPSCNAVMMDARSGEIEGSSEYLSYCTDGLYEIGVTEHGALPDATTQWVTWSKYWSYPSVGQMVLLPGAINNYYDDGGPSKLDLYIRVKDCEAKVLMASFSLDKLPDDLIESNVSILLKSVGCDNFTLNLEMFYQDSPDFFPEMCFPLTLDLLKGDGTLIRNLTTAWWNTDNTGMTDPDMVLDFDTQYKIRLTDKLGTILYFVPTVISSEPFFGFNGYVGERECGYYTMGYDFRHPWGIQGKNVECYLPFTITIREDSEVGPIYYTQEFAKVDGVFTITNRDAGGNLVGAVQTYSSLADFLAAALTPQFEYGITYAASVQYTGVPNVLSTTVKVDLPKIADFEIIYSEPYGNCGEHVGMAEFELTAAASEGITVTLTGPVEFQEALLINQPYSEGKLTWIMTAGQHSGNQYGISFPPGVYTLTMEGCGIYDVVTLDHPGLYSYDQFSYEIEEQCDGMHLVPKGIITFAGEVVPDMPALFKVTENSTGFTYPIITMGENVVLGAPGLYTLSIGYRLADCTAMGSIMINYAGMPPISIDPDAFGGYICKGGTTGHIFARAIHGVEPYTYKLYDANRVEVNIAPEILPDGRAHFSIPNQLGGETFNILIEDNCGNKSSYLPVTLRNLSSVDIAYATKMTVCIGDSIELHCVSLGINVTYNWTGPNGFTSDEQHPVINVSDASMGGQYYISVLPEFCEDGQTITDSVTIKVRDCNASTYVPVNPHLMNKAR